MSREPNPRKVLIFEWLNGGGLGVDDFSQVSQQLVQQGRAMLEAIAHDAANSEFQLLIPLDSRLPQTGLPDSAEIITVKPDVCSKRVLSSNCAAADDILLIAPESDSILLDSARAIAPDERYRLLSPDTTFIELTSDKLECQRYLQQQGFVQMTTGQRLDRFENQRVNTSRNWVIKPLDGAGAEETNIVTNAELDDYLKHYQQSGRSDRFMIEPMFDGTPASVSVICNDGTTFLTPTEQVFDRQPFGHYLHAKLLDQPLAARALNLAKAVVDCLPPTHGYFGIDMILGEKDVVVEINPRLTMSYLFLRDHESFNLFEAMVRSSTKNRNSN